MKTEYTIIWIDDNFRLVRGDVRNIARFLKAEEITLNLISINPKAGDNITEQDVFTSSLDNNEVDFIMIDFNMPGKNGLEVIEHLRVNLNDYHTPIIFYSNEKEVDLVQLIYEKNKDATFDKYLDGVFFCHRDDISGKVTNLLRSQLKKEGGIKEVRGLLMEKVSDIDLDILSAIEATFELVEDTHHQKLKSFIDGKLLRRLNNSDNLKKKIDTLDFVSAVNYLYRNPRATDNHFRAELMRKILDYIDEGKLYGKILSDFYNPKDGQLSLNCIRNKYAHQTKEELSGIHCKDQNLYIKSESRRHKENLTNILSMNKVED